MIIGVDDSGRGCVAGHMFGTACYIIDYNKLPINISDSKKTTPHQRIEIVKEVKTKRLILESTVSFDAETIDNRGLSWCSKMIMVKSVENLIDSLFENQVVKNLDGIEIIVDGNLRLKSEKYPALVFTSIPKADNDYIEVSLASIIAKTYKDREMNNLAKEYPEYGFQNHSGYLTKEHKENIKKFGVIDKIYRLSYKPMEEYR